MNKKQILTKRIEVYINLDNKEQRKESYKLLRDYAYHSRNMANDMMNTYASNFFLGKLKKENPDRDIKTIQDSFVSSKGERKGQIISLQSLGYTVTSTKYSELLPSAIRASLSQKVQKDFQNSIKDIVSGKRTFNSYKKDMPIFFMKNSISQLVKKEDEKNFTFNLFKIPFSTRLGRDKSNNESILDNIISGTYEFGDSAIQFVDSKLFLILTIKHEITNNEEKLDENKTLGVDLGMVFPAYVSIYKKPERKAIGNSQDFLAQRTRISSRRRLLQKNLIQTSGGHGRSNKLKKLENLKDSESNFVKTYNHTISKQIVEFALKNGCKYINIEILEGISRDEKNKFILRNWSYYQLSSMIKYKAEKFGITIREVDPSYTSQRCSNCGHIHRDNRVSQEKFICNSCKFEENADYNASQNISIAHTPEFEQQIKEHKNWVRENSDVVSLEEYYNGDLQSNKKKSTKKVAHEVKK